MTRRRWAGQREAIAPNGDKRYMRREARGRFIESDDVGWPSESARLRARWKEQDWVADETWMRDGAVHPPAVGASIVTATWHGWLEYLEHVMPTLKRGEVNP